MINPVEDAIEQIRQLPPRRQVELAAMLLVMASQHERLVELDYETRAVRATMPFDGGRYGIINA